MVLAPLRFPPIKITDSAKIKAFYDAVRNAEQTKDNTSTRSDRLAFIAQDSRVVVFGVSRALAGSPVLITSTLSSAALSELLLQSSRGSSTPMRPEGLQLTRITYSDGNKDRSLTMSSSKWAATSRMCRELMSHFSPIALKGNLRYTRDDIAAFYYTGGLPNSLEMRLMDSVSVGAVVLPDYLDWLSYRSEAKERSWPPATFDSNGKLETITFDIVKVYLENGAVRFALLDSGNKKGLFSDPVVLKREIIDRIVGNID